MHAVESVPSTDRQTERHTYIQAHRQAWVHAHTLKPDTQVICRYKEPLIVKAILNTNTRSINKPDFQFFLFHFFLTTEP